MTLAAAIALVAETGASAATGEKAYDFNIPGGSLTSVVTAIARTGGRLITFPPSVASGRQARPVVGHETVSQAISQAIAGSGLRLVVGVGGELTLKEIGTRGATSNAATDIADIDVTGNGSPQHDDGYQAGDAGTTVRIADAPAKEIPITVSSVTSDVLKDQAVTNVTDATQNIAGVTLSPSPTGTPTFNIRGFTNNAGQDSGDGLSVDGDRTDQFSSIPIDDVQRVDVLKGPTSILTGQGSGGGLVNIVTKEPTDQTIRDVTVRYGSYNYKTLAFDLGGIVPNTEGVTYRFNASANNADRNFGGYRDPHEFLISPALKWEDKDTSVLVGFRYVDTRTPHPPEAFAPGFATDPNGILRLPLGVAEGNPYFALNVKTKDFYSDQSHDFGSLYGVDFTLNNHVKYLITNAGYNSYFIGAEDDVNQIYGPTFLAPGQTSIDPFSAFFQQTRLSERVDLTLKYDVGFLKQTSKFGYDYSRQSSAGDVYGQDFDNSSAINYSTGQPGISIPTPNDYINNSFGDTFNDEREADRNTTSGFYYLEKVDTLNDRLHILGNVREDHFYSQSQVSFPAVPLTDTPLGSSQYALSWAAGGAFDVTPWFTVYGNRSNGFTAQFGINSANGLALPPQQRDLSEVGARFFLLDKRLTLTSSFYKLGQTNQGISDPNGVPNSFILLPGELSRGFEFEAQGQILPGWNVTAAFTAIGADYLQPTVAGTQVGALPHYVASIFTTYTVQDGPLSGVLVGFGAHGNTSSVDPAVLQDFGTNVNYKIPGYVVEDAVIGYTHANYNLTLKVNNLTNQYFFYPSYGPFNVPIGEGRNFVLAAKYSF